MKVENPTKTLIHLSTFWQTLCIHKRKSDYSGKQIVSVFPESCPYPVWHKDEWLEHSNPPSSIYQKDKDFWEQVWTLFKNCPIAHNIGNGNENSEYTDDCWYSKNCYLCHSLLECEDSAYLYRTIRLKDCQFCVFSFELQKCSDVVYGFDSYNVKYAIEIKRCKNSAFLFDCEDCEDCLLCWNLRNKKYCIGNKQLTKEQYQNELKKYNLNSRKTYETLKKQFSDFITKNAWWKCLHINNIENSSGDYLENSKNCKNCFLIQNSEDCENLVRGYNLKNNIFSVGNLDSEKVYFSCMIQDNCYDIMYCNNIIRSKRLEYCINCYNSENCFLCAGLVGKKYYILNKQYSESEYTKLKEEIISDMKQKGIYGEFFPAYFSATTYDESLAGLYYPISKEEQEKKGFVISKKSFGDSKEYKSLDELVDDISKIQDYKQIKGGYRDKESNRPFEISDLDINFSKKLGIPINDKFYIRRLKENFAWMFPKFEFRTTKCAISGKEIQTTLPEFLDKRIVSLEEYEKLIY